MRIFVKTSTFAASILKKVFMLWGGLAQLARAFDWQSKGHRFDSDILHLKKGFTEM